MKSIIVGLMYFVDGFITGLVGLAVFWPAKFSEWMQFIHTIL